MAVAVYKKHPTRIMAIPTDLLNIPSGVTISSVSYAASPAGLTVSASYSGSTVTNLVSSGVDGSTYRVTGQINLSNGERAIDLYDVTVDVNSTQ